MSQTREQSGSTSSDYLLKKKNNTFFFKSAKEAFGPITGLYQTQDFSGIQIVYEAIIWRGREEPQNSSGPSKIVNLGYEFSQGTSWSNYTILKKNGKT